MHFQPSTRLRRPIWAASVLVLLSTAPPSLADGVPPDQASAVQREQAQARFERGRNLFRKNQHEEALQEFRASHDIVLSPNTRLMIARCRRELGQLVEAYAEFGRTAVEARELEREDRRYGQAAESAEEERRELESQLGFVIVHIRNAGPDTTLKVAGEEIRRAGWDEPAPALPGDIDVTVETPGQSPVRKTVSLTAGQHTEVSIDARVSSPVPLEAKPQTDISDHTRTWAYVAGGIGLAGVATFAVAGIMSRNTYNDLESSCGSGPCPTDRQDDIDAGTQQKTIANVGLAVGVIGIGTGVALYLSSKPSKSSPEPSTAVVVSPSWIGVYGQM